MALQFHTPLVAILRYAQLRWKLDPLEVLSFIRSDIPFYAITNIKSDLEVAIIRIKSLSQYTGCNIYISPQEDINTLRIGNI